jgi:hypothetical protein
MINITRCFQDMRLVKAVTGTTDAEFNALLSDFERALARRPATATSGRRWAASSPPDGAGEALFYPVLRALLCDM